MFTLTERPHHFPGRTLLGDTRGPVVDTGVDQNGWIYINRIEAVEIGRCFGLVEPEVHDVAVNQIADLETALDAAYAQIEEWRPIITAVGNVNIAEKNSRKVAA